MNIIQSQLKRKDDEIRQLTEQGQSSAKVQKNLESMVSTLNEQIVELTSNGNKKTKELKMQMVQI